MEACFPSKALPNLMCVGHHFLVICAPSLLSHYLIPVCLILFSNGWMVLSLAPLVLIELNLKVITSGAVWQLQGDRFKFPAPWLLFAHSFPIEWACQCCPQVESVLLIGHQAVFSVTGGPVERGGISKYTRQHHEPKFKSQDEMGPC